MKKLIGILIIILMATSLQAQNHTKKKSTNGPELTFKSDSHDFGTLYQQSDGSFAFTFVNSGNEPVILSRPRSSCGCTVPSWPKEPLLPGDSSQIKVTYNTHIIGAFNKSVMVYSNAPKVIVLRIKGKVVPRPAAILPIKKNSKGSTPVSK